jgi:hypothetical protein
MAYAFDTLSYAKKLRDAGISQQQAEAHAEAAREFIMAELATRADIVALKQDIGGLEQRFQLALDNLSLRLTVRLGVLLAAGIAALGAS